MGLEAFADAMNDFLDFLPQQTQANMCTPASAAAKHKPEVQFHVTYSVYSCKISYFQRIGTGIKLPNPRGIESSFFVVFVLEVRGGNVGFENTLTKVHEFKKYISAEESEHSEKDGEIG